MTERLSINQAGNKLRKQNEDLRNGTFKKIITDKILTESAISTAPADDRIRYILTALKRIDTCSSDIEAAFWQITGEIKSSLSRKQIARFLKTILVERTRGYSIEAIARSMKRDLTDIKLLELLAITMVQEELKKIGFIELPSIDPSIN